MADERTIYELHKELVALCFSSGKENPSTRKRNYKEGCVLIGEMQKKIEEMEALVMTLDSTGMNSTRLEEVHEWISMLEQGINDFTQVFEITSTIASYKNTLSAPKSVKTVSTNEDLCHDDDLFDEIADD